MLALQKISGCVWYWHDWISPDGAGRHTLRPWPGYYFIRRSRRQLVNKTSRRYQLSVYRKHFKNISFYTRRMRNRILIMYKSLLYKEEHTLLFVAFTVNTSIVQHDDIRMLCMNWWIGVLEESYQVVLLVHIFGGVYTCWTIQLGWLQPSKS